jgi:hypothetical protein
MIMTGGLEHGESSKTYVEEGECNSAGETLAIVMQEQSCLKQLK